MARLDVVRYRKGRLLVIRYQSPATRIIKPIDILSASSGHITRIYQKDMSYRPLRADETQSRLFNVPTAAIARRNRVYELPHRITLPPSQKVLQLVLCPFRLPSNINETLSAQGRFPDCLDNDSGTIRSSMHRPSTCPAAILQR